MHTDIPALVEALIAPLADFAARFDLVAEDTRLATAAKLWVCYLRLAEAEAAASVGPAMAAFAAETQVGLRVHHIHTAGLKLSRMLARLDQLRPAIEQLGLGFDETTMARLTAAVSQARQEVQATRSPDPRLFPDLQVIHELQAALAPLPAQLADVTGRIWQVVAQYAEPEHNVQWRCPSAAKGIRLVSDRGIDYAPLRDLLAAGLWRQAHAETQRTMLVASGKTQQRTDPPPALYVENILDFPCNDLRTLDALWSWASAGRFGFATQVNLYQSLGGTDEYDFTTWQSFCYHVGWIREEPFYDIAAPAGHLPWIASARVMALDSHDALVYSLDEDEEAHWRFLFGIFFARVAQCLGPRDKRQTASHNF
jgi:hypothetical protein